MSDPSPTDPASQDACDAPIDDPEVVARDAATHAAGPAGGGETGALIRAHDWSRTPLGPIGGWSAALRATVSNIVNSPVAQVLTWGPDQIMLYNDAYAMIAEDRHPVAMGAPVDRAWPEAVEWNRAILTRAMAGETMAFRDQPMTLLRAGEPHAMVFDLFYTPVHDTDGTVGGVMCTALDNTNRVALEQRLAASELELRTITDTLPMAVAFIDRDHVFRFANKFYRDWFGFTVEQVVGRHVGDVIGHENYAVRKALMDRAVAGETIVSDAMLKHSDGVWRRADARYLPRRDADGQVTGFQLFLMDIENRVRREEALRASNSRFRSAMDATHGVLWTSDAAGRMHDDQPGWAALTGQAPDEYRGLGWTGAVHPDDVAATVEAWQRAVAGASVFAFEHRVRSHRGGWRNFLMRAVPVLGDDGAVAEWVGVHTDITHQRVAEEQLRQLNETLEARVIEEIATRRQTEVALAQAQKMETMGKLTGGVAHDFNNLLQVVSGNLQLLANDVAGTERAERRVANAMAGVARGSKLAAQLLAFGRRQALEPKVVNATRFVRDMGDMLARALGEGVEIDTIVGDGLWNTFIDPVQIENAILNLAINARDAMDGGGRLTIELANANLDADYARRHEEVVPGEYVMLAVSDTGSGMSAEVMDKAFEPFFSTKEEGKGSGLGLSMVYGFVKQSGGHVNIYSEPGQGTTVRLYLPRAVAQADEEKPVETGAIVGGTETVLVVEDDAEVRAIVVDLLADLGYRVLQAMDARSALTVIESGAAIDVLFTDVVMPGTLKSPELARKARELLPDIAVLFTSGYTQNSIVHGGRLDPGVELLSKPYTREALAVKFRQVIANRDRPPPHDPARQLTVLVVEDDAMIRDSSAEVLATAGHIVLQAANAADALAVIAARPIDVLITDVNLPDRSGLEVAEQAVARQPGMRIVIASGDTGTIVAAPAQALLLAKPYTAQRLIAAVRPTG